MGCAQWFDTASRFSDGLAAVSIGEKYAYINKTGKTVFEPRTDGAVLNLLGENFSEGMIAIELGGSEKMAGPVGKFGFMDKGGRIAIEPIFSAASNFSEGLASVCLRGKCGFIDKLGKFVIAPRFTDASSYSEGLARVRVGRKYGFIAR